jgi:predicted site-specific integrase-resolvase
MSQKIFLTAQEVAERWGVAKQNLATMRYHGTGPIYTKIGGRVRYELSDLEAYERAQRFERTDTRVSGD